MVAPLPLITANTLPPIIYRHQSSHWIRMKYSRFVRSSRKCLDLPRRGSLMMHFQQISPPSSPGMRGDMQTNNICGQYAKLLKKIPRDFLPVVLNKQHWSQERILNFDRLLSVSHPAHGTKKIQLYHPLSLRPSTWPSFHHLKYPTLAALLPTDRYKPNFTWMVSFQKVPQPIDQSTFFISTRFPNNNNHIEHNNQLECIIGLHIWTQTMQIYCWESKRISWEQIFFWTHTETGIPQ